VTAAEGAQRLDKMKLKVAREGYAPTTACA